MSASPPSPALFFDAVNAYQRTEVLRAAIELDVFTPLASGPQSARELAAVCNASERGIRILADYLSIMGLLEKKDERYSLTVDSSVFLNRKSPAYLGGTLDFLLTPEIRDSFIRQKGPYLIIIRSGSVSQKP